MESFPSIKWQPVAGWNIARLSRKTVEGRFLEGKLLKKLEIFFIPDPAVNVHEKIPIFDCGSYQAPTLLCDMETRCHSVLGIPIPISLAFWASLVGVAQNADRFDFA